MKEMHPLPLTASCKSLIFFFFSGHRTFASAQAGQLYDRSINFHNFYFGEKNIS